MQNGQLRFGLGDHQPAFQAHAEVGAELVLEAGPHPRGFDEEAIRGREERLPLGGFRALLILEAVVGAVDLDVQRAGVGTGGLAIERLAFDQQHLDAALGQVMGRGAAEDAAADDQHVSAGRLTH